MDLLISGSNTSKKYAKPLDHYNGEWHLGPSGDYGNEEDFDERDEFKLHFTSLETTFEDTKGINEIAALGCVNLWRAVIYQLFKDAIHVRYIPKGAPRDYTKENAIEWFTGNSEGFYNVCEFAHMCPRTLKRIFNMKIFESTQKKKPKLYKSINNLRRTA